MNVLTAIPVKSTLNKRLRERLYTNVAWFEGVVAMHENTPQETPVRSRSDYVLIRSRNLANARNELLGAYLKPEHTHVLWIDADVVEFPSNLAQQLLSISDHDIVAPMLLIEGTDRYYDTYTHVEIGNRPAQAEAPYFYSEADPVRMDCVGGCYIIPAEIFKTQRYEPWGGLGMEHHVLMENARRQGYIVYVTRKVKVYHANLPLWGEEFH